MSRHRDKYGVLKDEGKLYGTVTRARDLRNARNRLFTSGMFTSPPKCREVLLKLGAMHKTTIARYTRMQNPRLRRWLEPVATNKRAQTCVQVIHVPRGRYSCKCRYNKVDYEPQVRAYAVVTRKRLCWFVADTHGMWVAPRGWHFGTFWQENLKRFRVFACRDNLARDHAFRWYFDTDNIEDGEKQFWAAARAHVENERKNRRFKKWYERVTSTVITLDLVFPHEASCTVVRVRRIGVMSTSMLWREV